MRLFSSRTLWFFIVGAIAVLAHYAFFELRYIWYLSLAQAHFVRNSYLVLILVIIGLWIGYPSRLLVGLVGLFALVFPPFYDPNAFVPVDWPYAGFIVLSVGLLVAATQLRRRAF